MKNIYDARGSIWRPFIQSEGRTVVIVAERATIALDTANIISPNRLASSQACFEAPKAHVEPPVIPVALASVAPL